MSQYQVLARRYRPQTFTQVVGQEPVVRTLKNALKSGKTAHAYLFCGSRGTGKTTLARILAKALNCTNLSADFEPCNNCQSCHEITNGSSLDVLEIDGASHRGIDDIKQISESVGYCPASGQCKIYLIDEVHMLTKEAFNALLKTLEEPPPNVKFFFATTEANKIPPTILSRCQRFNLQRIPLVAIMDKLKRICSDMNVEVEEAALHRVATFAEGGLRDAESLFDQIIAFSQGKVTVEVVHSVLGIMPQEQFLALDQAVATNDLKVAFTIANTLFLQGKELSHFLEDLNTHYKALLLLKLSCQELLQDLDPVYLQAIKASAEIYTQEQCVAILELIQETVHALKNAISPQMSLENLLIKIVRIRLKVPIEAIARRLLAFEEKISTLKAPAEQEAPANEPPRSPLRSAPKPLEKPPTAFKEPPPPKPTPLAPPLKPSLPPVAAPKTVSEAPPPPVADDIQKNARYDTMVQFAAVELDGTVQRKRRK